MHRPRFAVAAALLTTALLAATPAPAADAPMTMHACRLPGVEHEARCGELRRALDPSQPQGTTFSLHFAVLPALARSPRADPVFFVAGGPGQSAIDLAGPIGRLVGRLGQRRDIVLVDQRGTGRSAPLLCGAQAPTTPLAQQLDPALQARRMAECRRALAQLPYGDLRFFTTALASTDLDAVRRALGAEQINLIGVSYGTRVVLDTMRQFPQAVRRAVLDGVTPSDMVLPQATALDTQAAFDALLNACTADTDCRQRHPHLRDDWHRVLDGLPRTVRLTHPVSGQLESVELTRAMLLGMVRVPLYSPVFASALPAALHAAADGNFTPLVGLSSALAANGRGEVAQGMHFSVICAEDALPSTQGPASVSADNDDFDAGLSALYRQVCKDWPRAPLPAGFGDLPVALAPTLLLSGGLDPVTPPRHGERVARALGPLARHEVVPNAGHGLLSLACVREAVFAFIDAPTTTLARQVPTDCARQMPRPQPFVPPGAAALP